MKAFFSLLGLGIILAIAWYLLSPVWRVQELNEPSPLAGEAAGTTGGEMMKKDEAGGGMDSVMKEAFDEQVAMMKDEVMVKAEVMPMQAVLLSQAAFVASAHDVKGKAVLVKKDGKKILRFEDFETINGPDLRIYLSTDLEASDYEDLGPIRATKGSANYELPAGIDTAKYRHVLVWCVPFSVLFSYASL